MKLDTFYRWRAEANSITDILRDWSAPGLATLSRRAETDAAFCDGRRMQSQYPKSPNSINMPTTGTSGRGQAAHCSFMHGMRRRCLERLAVSNKRLSLALLVCFLTELLKEMTWLSSFTHPYFWCSIAFFHQHTRGDLQENVRPSVYNKWMGIYLFNGQESHRKMYSKSIHLICKIKCIM